jgi:hypothetical protein
MKIIICSDLDDISESSMIPVSVTSSDSEKIMHRFGLFRGSSGATKFGLKKSKFWIGYFVRLGTGCVVYFYQQYY